jgi:hypothetical protein
MTQHDQLAQDHIDLLESQLLAADIENEELKQEIIALKAELSRMMADRSYCP